MKIPDVETVDPLAALPSTIEYVAYFAAQRPKDVAVIVDGREITYSAFYDELAKMVTALLDLGMKRGGMAAVDVPGTYPHLLVVLAFEAMGVLTFSYLQSEVPHVKDTLAAMDLVMCTPGREPPNAKRVQIMDEAWFDSVMAGEPEHPQEDVLIGLDTPLRIVKSSGTTGRVKWMIQTGRVFKFMIENYSLRSGLNRHSRFLVSHGFNLHTYYYFAVACIRMGGTCVYAGQEGIAETLAKYAITHVVFMPGILIRVLDILPEDYVKPADLTVFTISGPVSNELRARAKRVLATDVVVAYGSSEIGSAGTMAEDAVGTVLPGVRVEVVNDDGRPVIGEPGLVRVKGQGSVGAYIDDPETTERVFRGGWFYPGDVAVMIDRRTFKFIGRADDLLNIGGFKFAPQDYEEMFTRELPVDDLCLTTITDAEGIDHVLVVVVPKAPDGLAEIAEKIVPLLPDLFGEIKLLSVEKIPRTSTGKIQRNKLNDLLRPTQIGS